MWTAVQQVTLAHTLVWEFNPLTRLITCNSIGGRHTTSQNTRPHTQHLCSLAHSLSHRSFIQQPEYCQADWVPRRLTVPGGDHRIGAPFILVQGSSCWSIESIQRLLTTLEQISYIGTECTRMGMGQMQTDREMCLFVRSCVCACIHVHKSIWPKPGW